MPVAALVEPAFRSVPGWHATDGPLVAEVASMAGFGPDPEQALVLDALFAVDRSGRSVAFETAVVCCRQNMKTGLFKQAALGWLFITGQRLVVWSAHEFATAQEAFRDMDELVTGSDVLRKRVKNVYRGNGDESIVLTSGARLIFKTRTKGGGRGLSGDKVILDEGFALQPMHMGALLPTLSARPDPQVVYGSSAGLAESDVLRGIRDRGRGGDAERLAYFEWCAPDGCATHMCDHALGAVGCALDDEGLWQQANPALGRRIDLEYIRAERQALPPLEFARERLGWWDEPLTVVSLAVSPQAWADGLDPDATHAPAVAAFGVDVSPDRGVATIGMCGQRDDGTWHVEVVDRRAGTAWLVERCRDLAFEHGAGFAVDLSSPAASLVDELKRAGVNVVPATGGDVPIMCARFADAVTERSIVHGPQPELDAAIHGARKRPRGDGGFAFGRKASDVDITPLYAVTLAHWAATTAGEMSPINNVW